GRGVGGEGKSGGTVSVVMPQNWLFLTSYRKFREKLLKNDTWHLIARLGEGGFDSTAAAGAFVAMISLSRGNVEEASSLFKQSRSDFQSLDKKRQDAASTMRGLDVSEVRTAVEKAAGLLTAEIKSVEQAKQLDNPDTRVALEEIEEGDLLANYAICPRGIVTGDGERWTCYLWEIDANGPNWKFFQSTIESRQDYSGRNKVIDWSIEGEGMLRPGRDNLALTKGGVNVSLMRSLPVTCYKGNLYDQTTASIVPNKVSDLRALYCYCSSKKFNKNVREIDQKLNVTPATLIKVPFDLDHWTKVAKEKYPNGLPKPHSDDPTQWIFHGHPCGSVVWDEEKKWTTISSLRTDAAVLQTAVARLLGYRWPPETDTDMELSDESRAWVKKSQELLSLSDEDGIVCIPPVRGEMKAEDRLENLLAAAYGSEWSSNKKAELLAQADHSGKTLETWLREKFFAQHCKRFHHRPFIWHIWDGLRDGFAALVNYHKLDAKLLETLIYTYLGDWISRQKQDIAGGVDGAQEKLAAAEALKKKLELILEGEAPYDIFVRWKPIEKQPVGWNPDLNDGVRLNIRPFMTVGDVRKKGAGILRDKPNIKWGKDRGKDVASAPWYHLFKGDRINDHHLTLEKKRKAREQIK
ncbi:MAG: hypothetical protein KAU23_07335, partial [Anaerolineales bacterium]|nr:hypothetical protein [Anaerolineales bacterium]